MNAAPRTSVLPTSRPRILFVNRMAGTERGGGETFDLELARHLVRLGCRVTVLTSRPLMVAPRLAGVGQGITWVTLRAPMLPWLPWDRMKGGWRIRKWEFMQFERQAAAWIARRQEAFDILQLCELPYLVHLLKQRRVKPMVSLRLTAPNAYDIWNGIGQADRVIASGTSIAKIRATLRQDVVEIPNGVDLELFRPPAMPAAGPPTFLYVARFQDFKQHALLIAAFQRVVAQYPAARLQLAGSGPLRGTIEEQVRTAGLDGRVEFLGEVPHDQLPVIYERATAAVIASAYESFCFAAIEAMACGLPVVTTDCGWVPRLIGDQRDPIEKQWVDDRPEPEGRFASEGEGEKIRAVPGGLVVDRKDAVSLANAMMRVLDDGEFRARTGRWNRERAEAEHGWERSAGKFLVVSS